MASGSRAGSTALASGPGMEARVAPRTKGLRFSSGKAYTHGESASLSDSLRKSGDKSMIFSPSGTEWVAMNFIDAPGSVSAINSTSISSIGICEVKRMNVSPLRPRCTCESSIPSASGAFTHTISTSGWLINILSISRAWGVVPPEMAALIMSGEILF